MVRSFRIDSTRHHRGRDYSRYLGSLAHWERILVGKILEKLLLTRSRGS